MPPANKNQKMNIVELQRMNILDLQELARNLEVADFTAMRKQELIFAILKHQTERSGLIFAQGVLEVLDEGFGFLRSPSYNYLPGPDDIYVSHSQIKRFSLRTGDTISGQIRPPKNDEKYFALLRVEAINFEDPEVTKNKTIFENLTALHPAERFELEHNPKDMTTRILDVGSTMLVAPDAERERLDDVDAADALRTAGDRAVRPLDLLGTLGPQRRTDRLRAEIERRCGGVPRVLREHDHWGEQRHRLRVRHRRRGARRGLRRRDLIRPRSRRRHG